MGILAFFAQAAIRVREKQRRYRSHQRGAGILWIYKNFYDTAVFMGMEKSDILCRATKEHLEQIFPQISVEEWSWMYEMVLQVRFSAEGASLREQLRVRGIHKEFTANLQHTLSSRQKFLYHFIYCLG